MGHGLQSHGLTIFNDILGWAYFLAWSLSFYPQVWDNYKRKSVVGLSLDYLDLNVLGYFSYSIYNCAVLFNPTVQQEYISTKGYPLPVGISDVVFALHALALTLVCVLQALVYDRGGQAVHPLFLTASSLTYVGEYVLIMLIATGAVTNYSLLQYVEMCSYVKLGVTFVKYVPQAWSNYARKSTVGWAIWNVLLDLTGGLLSLLQQFLQVLNDGSWTVFTGNWAKTGLALFSIFFDLLFIVQHYILYPPSKSKKEDASEPFLSSSSSSSFSSHSILSFFNSFTRSKSLDTLPRNDEQYNYLSINVDTDN